MKKRMQTAARGGGEGVILLVIKVHVIVGMPSSNCAEEINAGN